MPLERFRKQRALADIVADAADVGLELLVGQSVGQQVQRLQNGQARAEQGDELLVENEELLDVYLTLAPRRRDAQARCRADGIDQVALVGEPLAQFGFAGRFQHLLPHLAPGVRVL